MQAILSPHKVPHTEIQATPSEIKVSPIEMRAALSKIKVSPIEIRAAPTEIRVSPIEMRTTPSEIKVSSIDNKRLSFLAGRSSAHRGDQAEGRQLPEIRPCTTPLIWNPPLEREATLGCSVWHVRNYPKYTHVSPASLQFHHLETSP